MIGRGLIKKAVAGAAAAASAFVAVVALGATIYFALALVVVPLAAAAITMLLFAIAAAVIAAVFLGAPDADEEEIEEPESLGGRAYALFRQRPILGTVAALAGGWIFLRNPALATMVAAAFTEKPHGRRR
ncbi:hypothetical protein [Brevundimonas sp.]|jgi:hypothetical protein|uniref:hypothetical protein n=1 Tax=Brevundimonas sp. TaxID=1871086 RepID=UPI002E0FCCED|nr:hypothetical protein [Brevundimonas sp.]